MCIRDSNYLDIHLRGKTTITADASGKLILPDGDTIQNVLRTYTHKYIHQQMQPQKKNQIIRHA